MLLHHHAEVDLPTNDEIRDTKNANTWPCATLTEMQMLLEHKAIVELPTNENSWYYHYLGVKQIQDHVPYSLWWK